MNNENNKRNINITNNFYGSVGQYVEVVEKQELHFDKDMQMQVLNNALAKEKPENGYSDERTKANTPTETDPSMLIFKDDEKDQAQVEQTLEKILNLAVKKSVICRELYQKKHLFKLHTYNNTEQARIINAWIKKFGIEQNFKGQGFSRQDFYQSYNKPVN